MTQYTIIDNDILFTRALYCDMMHDTITNTCVERNDSIYIFSTPCILRLAVTQSDAICPYVCGVCRYALTAS